MAKWQRQILELMRDRNRDIAANTPTRTMCLGTIVSRGRSGAESAMVLVLLSLLGVLTALLLATLLRAARARGELRPNLEAIGLGAVTNFFDTLGIGSFAPTTAYLKMRRMVPDSFLPATLNTG